MYQVVLLAFSPQAWGDKIDIIPKVITQVYDNWFWSAANYNPLERVLVRRIDLLVRKPSGNEQEVAGLRCRVKLAPVAPANVASPAQDICDCVLLSMVVYSGTGTGLNQKEPAPHWRSRAGSWIDCGGTLRPRRLCRGGIELIWTNDTNR